MNESATNRTVATIGIDIGKNRFTCLAHRGVIFRRASDLACEGPPYCFPPPGTNDQRDWQRIGNLCGYRPAA
jgi:hypothetical protein